MSGRKYPQPHSIEKELSGVMNPDEVCRIPVDKIHNGIKKNGFFEISRYCEYLKYAFLRPMGRHSNGHKTRPYKTG